MMKRSLTAPDGLSAKPTIVEELLFTTQLIKWMVIVAYRHSRGRWFYFRDAPLGIVATFASFTPDHSRPYSIAIIQAANEEWELRFRAIVDIAKQAGMVIERDG